MIKVGDKIKILQSSGYSDYIIDYIGTVVSFYDDDGVNFTVPNPHEDYDKKEWSTKINNVKLIVQKNIIGGHLITSDSLDKQGALL